MTQKDAIDLIKKCSIPPAVPQAWVDLGCGDGVFSYALASLLPTGSSLICIDKARQNIKEKVEGVSIRFEQANLESINFAPASLSGILMANSLHYVQYQSEFIKRTGKALAAGASWLIVEYDTDLANPWVPYPLSFVRLQGLFKSCGYTNCKKLGERPSVYGRANMYACEISSYQ